MKASFEKFYCPKCKKEFADGETECHNCGQPLKNKNVLYRCGEKIISRDILNLISGIMRICIGGLICWIDISESTFSPESVAISLIFLIVGLIFVIMGVRKIKICRTARCPHCKNLVTAIEWQFNCPICNKSVKLKGNGFETGLITIKYPKPQYEAPASSSLSFSNSVARQRIPTTNLEDDSRFLHSLREIF